MRRSTVRGPRVSAVLAAVRGPRVLHIGCAGQPGRASAFGSPDWLHAQLLRDHPLTVGLDYSTERVAAMNEAGIPEIHEGDAQDFDLGRRFDTVIAGELIEHVSDLTGFFQSCHRHLEPGGRLLLTTPYPFGIGHQLYAWLRFPKTCSNDEHVLWLCPTTLRQLADRNDFDVDDVEVVSDYRADLPSRIGRAFGAVARPLARVLPARVLGTNMVATLIPRP